MPLFPSTRLGASLLLLALALPTVWLGRAQATATVDARNLRLKAPDSAEARAIGRRVSEFGADDTLLIALAVPLHEPTWTATDRAAVAAIERAVASVPGVARVVTLPSPEASLLLRAAQLELDHPSRDVGVVVRGVEAAVEGACPLHIEATVTGQPAVEMAIAEAVAGEQRWIVPAIGAALFALLAWLFRSVGAAVATILPAGVAIAWTGGIFALNGHRLDPVAALLQPVLLTVGVASGVHLVDRYRRRAARPRSNAAAQTARDLLRPGLLACITTVLGFLANSLSPIPAVVDLAVYAAFGVALTAALGFWLVPAVLLVWPARRPARAAVRARVARVTTAVLRRRATAIVAAAAALAVWAGVACVDSTVDNDPLRILPADNAVRVGTERLAARLGGIELADVLVPAASPMAEPARLRLLAGDLASRPGFAGLAGPPLRARNGDVLLRAILPREGSGLRGVALDDLDASLAQSGAGDVLVTGTAVQVARDSNRLVRAQRVNLIATLGVLFATMVVALRSARLGCIGLLPCALVCAVVYGVIAAIGHPVSVATALIGSVMLGIVVDTTIHLLVRFQRAIGHRAAPYVAVASALARAGRPVLVTTLVLATGFSVAAFGRLSTTAEFGLLAVLTILVAAAISLTLVPALLLMRPEAAA